MFVIRSKKRDELQKYLLSNNIETLIHYPIPPHKQPAYNSWNEESFPITEEIHKQCLSMPISGVQNMDVSNDGSSATMATSRTRMQPSR
ncbi:DegT/DnrJ/EryC1/StrS family aminotransferase [Exiguobacterium profundum]|uniref:DegT/DnrJ/EryC1/StrS family aminotransferase n=1 Tax=Exiguobacterium profundum TaxID=307643 RepID=UPI003516534F